MDEIFPTTQLNMGGFSLPSYLPSGLSASSLLQQTSQPLSFGGGDTSSYFPNTGFGTVGAAPSFMDSLTASLKSSGVLGSTDANGIRTDGWGGLALGTAQGLLNAYMGMQQYGLAKDQLAFQKNAFAKNYAAQRDSINTEMEDRQRARVASNANAYESVSSYMDKNRIN